MAQKKLHTGLESELAATSIEFKPDKSTTVTGRYHVNLKEFR